MATQEGWKEPAAIEPIEVVQCGPFMGNFDVYTNEGRRAEEADGYYVRASVADGLREEVRALTAQRDALRKAAVNARRTLTEAYLIDSDRRQSVRMLDEALALCGPE